MSFKILSWIVAHHDFLNIVLSLSSSSPVSRSVSSKAMALIQSFFFVSTKIFRCWITRNRLVTVVHSQELDAHSSQAIR